MAAHGSLRVDKVQSQAAEAHAASQPHTFLSQKTARMRAIARPQAPRAVRGADERAPSCRTPQRSATTNRAASGGTEHRSRPGSAPAEQDTLQLT
jgi:hypothetical protein